MNLLLISDLNGNRGYYEFLVSQSEYSDAMLWAGNLTNPHSRNPVAEQEFVKRACGRIQAKGCRVLACGGETDVWTCPWLWLKRQGRFVAPGLFVTTQISGAGKRRGLLSIREAAWSAGAVWILFSRGPVAPGLLAAGAPESMLFWSNVALRCGPDLIVSSSSALSGEQESDWLQRRGHTWIVTPKEDGNHEVPDCVTLDTVRWTATRHSSTGTERRDVTAPRRIISTEVALSSVG